MYVIKIIDRDVLEPVNTLRHALGTSYIGISKVTAVATKINSQALGLTTVEQFDDKGFQMDNYREIIEDVDIVVDCTANKNFSLMLNQLCLEKHKTAVYITSHRKAFIGKVILVRPNIDPSKSFIISSKHFFEVFKFSSFLKFPKLKSILTFF